MDRLSDPQYRTYNYISRYTSFPYYYDTEDRKYIYGTTSQIDTESTPYTLYQVQKGDTYDSMALKFYNSPTFFWIICDFNRIQDPYSVPVPGTRLMIPSMTDISFLAEG